MNPVGISTSNLYETDLFLMERAKLALDSGADAIELGTANFKELTDFPLSRETAGILEKFKYVSVHISFKEGAEPLSSRMFDKLKAVCEAVSIDGIVVHPDKITAAGFSLMEKAGLPFLVENMDERKDFGTMPEHIEKIKNSYGFGFVFDTQHAWEHDPGLSLARELLDVMGDRLAHMHVSGNEAGHRHWPAYMAENKEKIAEILRWQIAVPKISEGKMSGNLENTISSELEYIRSFEPRN